MGFNIGDRLMHAWNAFRNHDPYKEPDYGIGYGLRPDRVVLSFGAEKSIVSSIYTRIAIDVASVKMREVLVDEEENYVAPVKSELNDRLSLRANKDQSGRAFIQDIVMSLCDEGAIALVPVETSINPMVSGSYNILSIRTAKILEWYPDHVRLLLYNDKTGQKEEITLPKKMLAILENPFYAVMNEPNSTVRRINHVLGLLDGVDTASASGKLDIIIQLPYSLKSSYKQAQAEKRRKQIEVQLANSKYGVAYIDATEHITQLNRPAENNLQTRLEYLTRTLFNQLGMTENIFNGTASEEEQLHYYNTTVEPFLSVIADGIKWAFLTKTARTQGHSIKYFRDPFATVPLSQIADVADKMKRNEIMTTNEIRPKFGLIRSSDPRANEIRNPNIDASNDQLKNTAASNSNQEGENQNGSKEEV